MVREGSKGAEGDGGKYGGAVYRESASVRRRNAYAACAHVHENMLRRRVCSTATSSAPLPCPPSRC